ncbi:MAG: hypothetical protein J6Q53_03240 [Oscillospiraceae bacterium]|nr:hypothetical protein [Oscillospiraceae bacterium]
MAQGTIYLTDSGTYGAYLRSKIEWRSEADTTSHTSTVTAELYICKYNPNQILTVPTTGTYSYALEIGGSRITGSVYLSVLLDWVKVAIHTVSGCPHEADGSCVLSLWGSVSGPSGTSLAGHTTSGGGQAVLDTLSQAGTASFSAEAVDMGQAVTVYTNRLSDGFTCGLTYSFAGVTGTIAENVTDQAQWIPSLELAWQIPNTDHATAIITCHTYQNGRLIGSKDNYLTLWVPDNICPTVSAAWQDTTGAYGLFGTLVQNASALEIDITAAGAYGSQVQTSAVTLNGKPYTGQTILDEGILPLEVTVTDSRGHRATARYDLTVAAYSLPALELTAHRCTADGTANDAGEYAQITAEGSITDLSGLNAPALTISWEGGSQSFEAVGGQVIVPAPIVNTLAITARLEDRLYSVSRDMVLSTGYATLDFLAGGKGISMGKAADREGFDCAMPAYFTAGLNGAYLQTHYVGGTPAMQIQTKYTDFSGAGDNRQSIFLFGTANFSPVHGLLQVNNGGSVSWSGTGSITVTAMEEGKVELTLPTWAWDWFTALSAEPFHFL